MTAYWYSGQNDYSVTADLVIRLNERRIEIKLVESCRYESEIPALADRIAKLIKASAKGQS